ncbi:hypothetical protein M3M33_15240, partial [Loigolactobacillus coryniformis]|uniref:hypothetical protein n=1 Tax=Loigolactobacillus coryniformis TaxID=1610 RepID=UPI00201A6650
PNTLVVVDLGLISDCLALDGGIIIGFDSFKRSSNVGIFLFEYRSFIYSSSFGLSIYLYLELIHFFCTSCNISVAISIASSRVSFH